MFKNMIIFCEVFWCTSRSNKRVSMPSTGLVEQLGELMSELLVNLLLVSEFALFFGLRLSGKE